MWQERETQILAPGLLPYEVANALFQRARRGDISSDDAARGLEAILAIGPELDHHPAAHTRAIEFAQQFSRPTPYDAHYLALAEREGCEFWTADERLWNAVRGGLPWVRWIGEYQATTDDTDLNSGLPIPDETP